MDGLTGNDAIFSSLPVDIKRLIFKRIPVEDCCRVLRVCKEWAELIWPSQTMWCRNGMHSKMRLAPLSKMTQLTMLDIEARSVVPNSSPNVSDYSMAAIRQMRHLSYLYVDSCYLMKGITSFVDSLFGESGLPNLRRLEFFDNFGFDPRTYIELQGPRLIKVLAANCSQLRYLELPHGWWPNGGYTSQSQIESYLQDLVKLEFLEYLSLPCLQVQHDWSTLRSLKHLKQLCVRYDRLSIADVDSIIQRNLGFVELFADYSCSLSYIILECVAGPVVQKVLQLLNQYEQNGVMLTGGQGSSICSGVFRTHDEPVRYEVLLHPLVIADLRRNPEYLCNSYNWSIVCKGTHPAAGFRATIESILDALIDRRQPIPLKMKRVVQGLLSYGLTSTSSIEQRYIATYRATAIELCQTARRIVYDRYPDIIYESPDLFPNILVAEPERAHELFRRAATAERARLLTGTLNALIADGKLTTHGTNAVLTDIIRSAIELHNSGAFDQQYQCGETPLKAALDLGEAHSLQLLVELGYLPRLPFDAGVRMLEALVQYSVDPARLKACLSIFPKKTLSQVRFSVNQCPARSQIISAALAAGMTPSDAFLREIVRTSDSESVKVFLDNVNFGGPNKQGHQHLTALLDAALISGSSETVKLLLCAGADISTSRALRLALEDNISQFVFAGLLSSMIQLGFDVNNPDALDGKTILDYALESSTTPVIGFPAASGEKTGSIIKLLLMRGAKITRISSGLANPEMVTLLASSPELLSSISTANLNCPLDVSMPPLLHAILANSALQVHREALLIALAKLLSSREDWDILTPYQGRNFIDFIFDSVSAHVVLQHFVAPMFNLPGCAPYVFASLCRISSTNIHWDDVKDLFNVMLDKHRDSAKVLVKGRNALHHAAYCGSLEFIQPLLDSGVFILSDKDDHNETPLMCALSNHFLSPGKADTVKFLLEKTVQLDPSLIYAENGEGKSALDLAAAARDASSTSALLRAGAFLPSDAKGAHSLLFASIDTPELLGILLAAMKKRGMLEAVLKESSGAPGWTLLVEACAILNVDSVKLLLDYGSPVDQDVPVKTTPLVEVAKKSMQANAVAIAKLLVERGADPNRLVKGKSASQFAKHREVAKILTPVGDATSLGFSFPVGFLPFASQPTPASLFAPNPASVAQTPPASNGFSFSNSDLATGFKFN